MADRLFEEPSLARLYDPFDPDRSDLDAYRSIVGELGARRVLDIGCGTGTFACMLGRDGVEVVGLDPALASFSRLRLPHGEDPVIGCSGLSASGASALGPSALGPSALAVGGWTLRNCGDCHRRRSSQEEEEVPMSVEVHVEGRVLAGLMPRFAEAVEQYKGYARTHDYAVPKVLMGLSGEMNTVRLVYRFGSATEYEEQEVRTL